MEKIFKSIGVFIAIITISFLALHSNNEIGTYKENIEMDARSSQKVPVGWQVSKDTTQTMSAMIFYDESRINHTFSIPFAFILPINIGTVTLYDINGNVVESQRQGL